MTQAELKAQNIQAVQDAKHRLSDVLAKHGLVMKGWGKANAYNVISELIVGRKDIQELNCFKESE